ncbi:hypothetical protein [Maritimibacter sp. DP1N21-5]|uniref:hypothetical protein n=1 Tax=Maritimibacter sp. DP1N21-5 TaxID=2836867 RepID=UPI001C43B1B5|nr:hypothetical protein [Maritimibacter sp. DP1N21-5]MBV7407867.1 hypothetical protein [Maritimibacter sp. DP1N21-5]
MRRLLLAVFMMLGLAACSGESVWAPDEEVQRAVYRHPGPPTITLFTVIGTKNGQGGHSGLMINGSQRILFDPAGTFNHPQIPERNDVLFGFNDRAVAFYEDYHARETWYIVRHEKVVTPEVAQLAMQLAMNYGAVPKAYCASSISDILRQVPGFQSLPSTMFPVPLMEAFKGLGGVTESVYRDNDPDFNGNILAPAIR